MKEGINITMSNIFNKKSAAIKVHMALSVFDLEKSKCFYNQLFNALPVKEADDQIDWILTTPPVHFSIYANANYGIGIEHMGFVYIKENLQQERDRLVADETGNIFDPDGNKIELYSLDN